MEIVDHKLMDYIEKYSTATDDVLTELYRETYVKVLNPRMISGPVQGKLLELVSRMINPSRILEIGTYTGYSAICLAKGLANGGLLHTIDKNDEIAGIARRYFDKAGLADRIVFHTGDALEIIPGLNELFDLVFIDADKEEYIQYYELAFAITRPGGFLLADNVLWDGKVLEKKTGSDRDTKAIMEFNEYIRKDKRVEHLILPLRDGISIIRKIQD